MSHGSEEGENYWPGYVDALTSMVQVLAFVMMMLAMAVFALSQSVAKHAVEAIANAVKADVKPNADVKQITQAVMDKLDQLRGAATDDQIGKPPEPAARSPSLPLPAVDKSSEARFAGAKVQPDHPVIDIRPDSPRLTIGFEEKSSKIESSAADSVSKFISGSKTGGAKQTIVVNAFAYSGDGAISEARRLAYYRGMMARKQLIDAKVHPEDIRITVNDTNDKSTGATVELIVAGQNGH